MPATLKAQDAISQDTVAYKIGFYDIKGKPIKVFLLASKLGVDPQIIVRLNKLRNIQQDLVVGQRVKIPVYPKGYRYEPEKVVVRKAPVLDSTQMQLIYGDTVKKVEASMVPDMGKEVAVARLEMINVLIELNEAMVQGVKASIDSVNVVDSSPVDEKNVQAMLQRMKRSRDKVLLLPYLQNIQDSLTQELIILNNERKLLENIISPKVLVVERDTSPITLSSKQEPIAVIEPVEVNQDLQRELLAQDKVILQDDARKSELKRNEKRGRRYKEFYPVDTVIVYDLGPTLTARSRPEPELNPVIQSTQPKGLFWDTARAIMDPGLDSIVVSRLQNPLINMPDTAQEIKINIPNTLQTVVIKPIRVPKPEPVDTPPMARPVLPKDRLPDSDTLTTLVIPSVTSDTITPKSVEMKPVADSVKANTIDTTFIVQSEPVLIADTIARPVAQTRKPTPTVADMAIAAADSVKRIKAEFLYKRAQRAMNEKNFRNAEQYLKKAVELNPRYYDAWFALAEMDDLFGSAGLALKEYKMCESIDSSKPRLFYNMGNIYLKLKRKSDAYNSFDKAIDLDPTYILALMARASILTDWKQYDAAVYDYDKVINISRSYHYAYKARGHVHLIKKDFTAAINDFTRFLIFEETDPSAYYYRGLAKIGSNDLLEGCLDLSKAAEYGYTAAEKAIKKTCQ